MKRMRITEGMVGLVFRNGNYERALTSGVYWFWRGEWIETYKMSRQFCPAAELNILKKDKNLMDMLSIVEVNDDQICLRYEEGIFREVLTPGRYFFWKGMAEYSFVLCDLNKIELTEAVSLNVLRKPEVLKYVRVFQVESYEKGLLYVDGKFVRELERGTHHFWVNAISVIVQKVDLRQQRMEISGQEILTKDKAALRVNLEVLYRVKDITRALVDNRDFEKQLYVVMQLAVREFIGAFTLDDLLENKDSMNDAILKASANKTQNLGVEVVECGIKDIILPGEIKEIMNQVLVAQKQAQANVIMRREETASTRSLLNTAKLMEDNPVLLTLKEMEHVEKIAEKINNITLSGGGQIVSQLREIFT